MGNVHMEAAQINYRGGEKKMSVEEALKNSSGEAAAIAQLQGDVSDLNSNKANKADIATEFSDLTNYNAGDLVYYDGALYEFQLDHEAGAWETSEVIQKDLSDIVTTLMSGLTNVDEGVITPETGVTLTNYALKKSINTVSISALVQLTPTLGSNNVVGVIPSEYRPSDRVYITCINSTSDKIVIGFVDKYGGIYIYPTSNDSSAVAQNYNINGVFVVG